MFKRCFAMMLALCLLLTTSSVAFMEDNTPEDAFPEVKEIVAEPAEASVEEGEDQNVTEITENLGDDDEEKNVEEDENDEDDNDVQLDENSEGDLTLNPEQDPEGGDNEDAAKDANAEQDAENEEEASYNNEEDEEAAAPVVEEAPAAEEAPVAAEAQAAAEAPAAAAPVVVEESADTAAKIETAEAMEAGTTELVLTKNTKYTATMGTFLQLNLGGVAATFKSSKKKVATVDANGLVACVGAGKTTITATITKKNKIKLTLTVVDPTIPSAVYLSVDGAAVSGTITAAKGVPFVLTPAVAPEGTAVTGYKWSSSKKKVATVNGAGIVTPKKVGTTKITVKTTRGKKKRSIKVKVIDPFKATAVYLNKTGLIYMTAKSALQLEAAMTTASGQPSTSTLKWSSSNKKIATVNQNGLVYAKKKGTVKITVKTSSGKKRSVKIKVFPLAGAAKSMTPEWVALDDDNTMNPNDLFTYVVAMDPLNANANVVWSVGATATEVIRIENAYRGDDLKFLCEVRAVGLGFTTLTATDTVTGLSHTVKVIVKTLDPPTSITLPNGNSYEVAIGKTIDVPYVVNPSTSLYSEYNHAVVSQSPEIASIKYDPNNADRNCPGTMDYKLHITGTKAGTSTVTITLRNGVKASFTLTVK